MTSKRSIHDGMRGLRAAALLALCACASPAFALDCKNATTTVDMNQCAASEQKQMEATLNLTYQRVLKAQPPRVRTKLVAAQRMWIKFREADCDAVFEKYAGGTMRNVAVLGCMQRRAGQRIKELDDYVTP